MSERHEHLAPKVAIAVILGFVAVYDAVCKRGNTISEQVDRWRESDRTSGVTNFVIDSLYKHLKRSVPPEEDPVHWLASLVGKD